MSNSTQSSDLAAVLHAGGPAPDRAEALQLYGQFVGDWDADIVTYTPDGVRHEGKGEIHFGWVLEGRAVQDVWMIPRRHERHADALPMPVAGNWYGTTIRVFDPALDAWRIYWIDPATNAYYQQIGRRQGADIVQEGTTEKGALSRWSFTGIKPDSFHWKGEVSSDKGASWSLLVEVIAHRVPDRRDVQAAADSEQLRAFDFWQGAWHVSDPESGKVLGVSRVDSILGGRVLHEQWSGADGYRGESFNIFDKDRRCWHQSWVSDNGTLLLLDGGMTDGAMELKGASPDGDIQRIRWTPHEDGSVVQLWESSGDGGLSWSQRFKGLYRRA